MSVNTFRGDPINLPDFDFKVPTTKDGAFVPIMGERIDNVAFVIHGSNLDYPTVMKKNNIGFLYDTPPFKKIIV